MSTRRFDGAFEEILRALDAGARPGLLDELIRADQELLLASAPAGLHRLICEG